MSMFCYQCQETAKNRGCTRRGVCGKAEETANLQDLLVYVLRGIAVVVHNEKSGEQKVLEAGRFTAQALFATITNANFDDKRIVDLIRRGLALRDSLRGELSAEGLHDSATWSADSREAFFEKAGEVGVLSTSDEDLRSLRELLVYGLKGIAAYADHAAVLGYEDAGIYGFLLEALAATTEDLDLDAMTTMVLKAGETAVQTMALLDRANTETYGSPEITKVNLGTRDKPGILISGHDLRDLDELLQQTEGRGIDVYTHGEMLPAHSYPAFKKYDHFVGNYGGSWWRQDREFETFNGPILMTTNCLIPVRDAYRSRLFTTGMAGYPGIRHIPDRGSGGSKDFSEIIALAAKCPPPIQLEQGELVGGFAHEQILKVRDELLDAVKSGAVKRFVVMAGCDGRHRSREYFTEVAKQLPRDTVILTAGCAKYRYNKLPLGQIGTIPRVLDAGQCNDSYSLALVALKLKEALGIGDINELPISYDIAWYEQKAVAVLLALLSLGVKNIRLGPTLPAFVSPAVLRVLVERFNIQPTGDAKEDVQAMYGT
jgi:hydroxylamine reductase